MVSTVFDIIKNIVFNVWFCPVPSSSEKWSQAHKLMSSSLASRAAGSSLHVEELRSEIAKKAEDWKRECEGMGLRLGRGLVMVYAYFCHLTY
jgi:hypothetical protein